MPRESNLKRKEPTTDFEAPELMFAELDSLLGYLLRRAQGAMHRDFMLFGSDYPLITPDRWIKDFQEAGFKPEVHDLILKQNAIRALGLDRV